MKKLVMFHPSASVATRVTIGAIKRVSGSNRRLIDSMTRVRHSASSNDPLMRLAMNCVRAFEVSERSVYQAEYANSSFAS